MLYTYINYNNIYLIPKTTEGVSRKTDLNWFVILLYELSLNATCAKCTSFRDILF